jgi:ABC-type lipoprotein release transport system permease subunit
LVLFIVDIFHLVGTFASRDFLHEKVFVLANRMCIAGIIVAAVATTAIVVPARHAMNADPLEAIRYE